VWTEAIRQLAPRRPRPQDPEDALRTRRLFTRYAARLVRQQRLDGSPLLVGDFVESNPSLRGLSHRSVVSLNMPCRAFFALSCLGYQPIVKRLHAGPLQGTLWIDHVIGEAGRQAEFERPQQPSCGKIVCNQSATAEHDALAPGLQLG
jgi:hypothetical protein